MIFAWKLPVEARAAFRWAICLCLVFLLVTFFHHFVFICHHTWPDQGNIGCALLQRSFQEPSLLISSHLYLSIYLYVAHRRKFRSQTSDNMDRWKAEVVRVREEKRRREKIREEKESEDVRRKKIQVREKVEKSRFTVFFQWFVAPEGRKVGWLKRRVRSHVVRWEMKSCTPLWRKAHFQVKMCKAHQVRSTFGSWNVQKVHAVVARSTFASQNAQNISVSDRLWKLRCRKSARRCGAKHISSQNVQNTSVSDRFWKLRCPKSVRPLLQVEMSKKGTPLWREAHIQVKMYKTHQCRTTFASWDVQKVHAIGARSTFTSQNVKSTTCFDHFWRFGCGFAWQAHGILHLAKSEQNVRVL